jgi:hypothetical protein
MDYLPGVKRSISLCLVIPSRITAISASSHNRGNKRDLTDLGLPRNRTNRLHEGCGEEWESGDVVWLGLRLDYQLDAGAGLEWLGEVALLTEGNDVVVKGLEVAVGDDGDSEGGVLAAVLGDAAGG